jgi:hypothetical protein
MIEINSSNKTNDNGKTTTKHLGQTANIKKYISYGRD